MSWEGGNDMPDGSTLSFLISGAGLTLTSFLAGVDFATGTEHAIFAANVVNNNRTVVIDGVSHTPLASLILT